MRYLLLTIFVSLVCRGFAQVENEIPFLRHLINKRYYDEAIYLIDHKLSAYPFNSSQKDSLFYFQGWAHYSLKNLEQSTQSLLGVSKESPFYYKSHFFAGYNQIYLGNYSAAQSIFNQMNIRDEPYWSLLGLEMTGIEMLKGNWSQAKEKLELIDGSSAALSEQVAALEIIYNENQAHRSKSPVLAGIMSGIVPGSGKIYAGKTGAGIASLAGTIGFGLITWENYHKRGIKNSKTIIFGSLFVVNYISNIYGSVLSVKVSENEYKNAVHNQILFQLHVPLRNFFD